MGGESGRIRREQRIIEAMTGIYCGSHHGKDGKGLCPDCSALLEYALARLDRCPFQENKTTCANCSVHCYRPDMREKVKGVMRYAGPRIARRHPVLAVFHFLDGFRKPETARSNPMSSRRA